MNTPIAVVKRISSIDLLRGLVMVIMALDHARDYFHKPAYFYDPTDLSQTTPVIFFTRWITHFCAPVFIFLAGTSAFIAGQKKTKKQLSFFLLTRGIWLMLIELTVMNFGWLFNPSFSLFVLQVIWVLGCSMVILSALIHLPIKWIAGLAVLIIAGHNLLDAVHVKGNNWEAFGWAVLHEFNIFDWNGHVVAAAYPIVPWVGVMALGYCAGKLYQPGYDAAKRKQILLWSGIGAVAVFILLRYTNIYGDASAWQTQSTAVYSVLSFLNVSKYPPSLLYVLITLGPAVLFLAISESWQGKAVSILSTFGRVPFFYYVIHVYLFHFFAMIAAELTGWHWYNMIIKRTWLTGQPSLKGYGFNLLTVYTVWLLVVLMLYPLCRKYDAYKLKNKDKWWLSYL